MNSKRKQPRPEFGGAAVCKGFREVIHSSVKQDKAWRISARP